MWWVVVNKQFLELVAANISKIQMSSLCQDRFNITLHLLGVEVDGMTAGLVRCLTIMCENSVLKC